MCVTCGPRDHHLGCARSSSCSRRRKFWRSALLCGRLMSSNWAALQAKLGGGGGGRGGGSRGAGGGRGGGRAGATTAKAAKAATALQNLLRQARAAAAARRAAALCGAGRAAAPRAGRPPLRRGGGAVLAALCASARRRRTRCPPPHRPRRGVARAAARAAPLPARHRFGAAARRLGADADGGVAHPRRRARRHLRARGPAHVCVPVGRGGGRPAARRALRALNDALVAHTERLNGASKAPVAGSCRYNLSLVNLLLPDDARGGALRNRAGARLGGAAAEQAVSWHADSGVEPNSAIAVLNLEPAACQRGARARSRGASQMKCVGGGHEPTPGVQGQVGGNSGTPAIAVPLRDGDAYYMLCGFNEAHHHAVLAGSSGRYSSTHRVGLSATDTWSYIEARAAARGAPPLGDAAAGWRPLTLAAVRLAEEAHTEIELEWLRPWAAQGSAHAESHGRLLAAAHREAGRRVGGGGGAGCAGGRAVVGPVAPERHRSSRRPHKGGRHSRRRSHRLRGREWLRYLVGRGRPQLRPIWPGVRCPARIECGTCWWRGGTDAGVSRQLLIFFRVGRAVWPCRGRGEPRPDRGSRAEECELADTRITAPIVGSKSPCPGAPPGPSRSRCRARRPSRRCATRRRPSRTAASSW